MPPASAVRGYRTRVLEVDIEPTDGPSTLRWGAILFLVLATGMSYVWLRSTTEKQAQELQAMRLEFADRGKEVDNLRVECESFTGGEYIQTAVRRFKLDLHPPLPGQVRRMALSSESPRRAETTPEDAVVAQRW